VTAVSLFAYINRLSIRPRILQADYELEWSVQKILDTKRPDATSRSGVVRLSLGVSGFRKTWLVPESGLTSPDLVSAWNQKTSSTFRSIERLCVTCE
jgi:hypothetical protein